MTTGEILKNCKRFGVPYVTMKGFPKDKGCINPVLIRCLIKAIENDGFISSNGKCIILKRNELLRRLKKHESS